MLALFGGMVLYTEYRDRVVSEQAVAYEKCVKSQYGKTPQAVYADIGKYPPCVTD